MMKLLQQKRITRWKWKWIQWGAARNIENDTFIIFHDQTLTNPNAQGQANCFYGIYRCDTTVHTTSAVEIDLSEENAR